MQETQPTEELTPREQEILDLLLDGMTLKEITGVLNISLKTVDFHKKNLFNKLGVQNSKELYTMYMTDKKHISDFSNRNPLIIILENENDKGWRGNYYAEPPFYDDKIEAGDRYIFNCTYKSNVHIPLLQIALADNKQKNNREGELSGYIALRRDIEPNIEYNDSITIFTAKSASSTEKDSNVFLINAYKWTKEQPTLIFTKFEIIQNNIKEIVTENTESENNDLTSREQELLQFILDGITFKNISEKLNISLSTVNFHRDNLYRKLNIQSNKELFTKYLVKKQHKLKLTERNPMIMIMGNDGEYGWQTKYYAIPPFYSNKINEGDNFIFKCSYKSNVYIDFFQVALVDNLDEETGDDWWNELCGFIVLRKDVKPDIEYNDSLILTAKKSASSSHINSNVLVFNAYKGTKERPKLIFTDFEISQA